MTPIHETDAALAAWGNSDEAVNLRVQFQRIERLLEGLPGSSDVDVDTQAAILGVDIARLRDRLAEHRTRVAAAARQLAASPAASIVGDAYQGKTILCYGDSITADQESWAEILAVALGPAVTLLNRGRSGDTTGDLLSRFVGAVSGARADIVITMVGTNDGRRYGALIDGETEFGPLAISDADTAANLAQLDRMIRGVTGTAGLWMTPPPVDDARIREHPSPRSAGMVWRTADIAKKAELLPTLFPGRMISTATAFAVTSPDVELLLPDGLHPTLNGQLVLAHAAMELLAATVYVRHAG